MPIRIPMMSRKEDMEPIQEVVRVTAEQSGRSEHEIAKILSWAFQAIADEVARGKVVRFPGFGIWAPVPHKHPTDDYPRCRPEFSPSLAFRRQVIYGAPPNRAGATAIRNHKRNNTRIKSVGKQADDRVFTAQEHFRNVIDNQLARARG